MYLPETTPPETTPPETTIDSGPDGLTIDSTPTFSFSGSDNESTAANLLFSYKVDNEVWSEYSYQGNVTLGGETGLSDGSYTFYVKAKDQAGNVDESPAESAFTVDATAPTITASKPTKGATGVRRGTNITATFSKAMDPTTLVTNPTDPANPNVGISETVQLFRGTNTTPVAATVTVSPDGKTVMLDPKTRLAAGTRYRVKIIGAKNLAGNTLRDDYYSWTFKTRG